VEANQTRRQVQSVFDEVDCNRSGEVRYQDVATIPISPEMTFFELIGGYKGLFKTCAERYEAHFPEEGKVSKLATATLAEIACAGFIFNRIFANCKSGSPTHAEFTAAMEPHGTALHSLEKLLDKKPGAFQRIPSFAVAVDGRFSQHSMLKGYCDLMVSLKKPYELTLEVTGSKELVARNRAGKSICLGSVAETELSALEARIRDEFGLVPGQAIELVYETGDDHGDDQVLN